MNNKIIAIDFDGTIVEDNYPEIGRPLLFAFETMQKLQSKGYRLILWTYRSGKALEEAIEFCRKNGIEFYSVNSSYEGEVFEESQSRKINADYFIDDRNLGGFPGWGEVYQIIKEKIEFGIEGRQIIPYSKKKHRRKKSFLSKLFGS
ncbi:hypothetical protein ETU08_04030 [Apibacter muscae]|uniref:Hydrolase n=1 Tax=Apibacter muscae TaxID=2509004 RepID=A0A563DE49_9FLAO|nr:hypothetical protein [Apibacter muscae]TWP23863.1 hypothetical protein ETU10_06425 [Apibacter muscae]TWP28470.1 hypothetical protein ETU09_05970 [Apibacter muscae]TWP30269.1 hypothetical protein ETU08_04030 [Apibacter muscae]